MFHRILRASFKPPKSLEHLLWMQKEELKTGWCPMNQKPHFIDMRIVFYKSYIRQFMMDTSYYQMAVYSQFIFAAYKSNSN